MDIMLKRIIELIGDTHGATTDLATFVGVPPNRITDWKAGRVKSYTKYASKIADFYGVSLDWLSGKTDIKEAASKKADGIAQEQELELIVRRLSPDSAKDLLWFARALEARQRNE